VSRNKALDQWPGKTSSRLQVAVDFDADFPEKQSTRKTHTRNEFKLARFKIVIWI
jgi:hypothetical protein